MSTSAPPAGGPDIELEIGGMTCASCANRIEKKLNKLDGVSATVNYATEKAKVTVPTGYDPALLIAEVEKTGYTAALPKPKLEVRYMASPCSRNCVRSVPARTARVSG